MEARTSGRNDKNNKITLVEIPMMFDVFHRTRLDRAELTRRFGHHAANVSLKRVQIYSISAGKLLFLILNSTNDWNVVILRLRRANAQLSFHLIDRALLQLDPLLIVQILDEQLLL